MIKPITDKAEVSIDFPNKHYMGSFTRHSAFDVKADAEGIHIHLDHRSGEKRKVGFHVHYFLLADMLKAMAEAIESVDDLDPLHQQRLAKASEQLREALAGANEKES